MKKRLVSLFVLVALLSVGGLGNAHAAAPTTEKGLLITPVRQFISTDAGSSKASSFSIANLTDNPLTVTLSVKQFSVTDYTYNYTFQNPSNDWVHLSSTSLTLQSRQSKDIAYTVQAPAGTAPGGYYYTLFASATISNQGVNNTIQATDLMYLTVNGNLTTVSHLEGSTMPWVVFGQSIPFSLNPINTGNEYSFVYVSGQLHGLFVKPPKTSAAHLLMPGKVRALSDSIPSPVLPGIYRATYGYKTTGGWVIQQSHWVVFIPPWFIALLLAAVLIFPRVVSLFRKKKASETEKPNV